MVTYLAEEKIRSKIYRRRRASKKRATPQSLHNYWRAATCSHVAVYQWGRTRTVIHHLDVPGGFWPSKRWTHTVGGMRREFVPLNLHFPVIAHLLPPPLQSDGAFMCGENFCSG